MPDRTEKPLIRIIDDDPELCEAQSIYIRYCGLDCVTYPTADQFLAQDDLSRPGCLILDVEMPGMNGLTLQQEMGRRGIDLPILFLSAHGSIAIAIQCVRRGAFNFLEKPPDPDQLIDLVNQAIRKNLADRRQKRYARALRQRYDTLTAAEKQVAVMVAKGLNTPTIAEVLKVSENTVKSHRRNLYSKLDVANPVELNELLQDMEPTDQVSEKTSRA